jgi:hypothetical protein
MRWDVGCWNYLLAESFILYLMFSVYGLICVFEAREAQC